MVGGIVRRQNLQLLRRLGSCFVKKKKMNVEDRQENKTFCHQVVSGRTDQKGGSLDAGLGGAGFAH